MKKDQPLLSDVRGVSIVLGLLLVAGLMIVAGGVAWYWQQREIDSLQAEIATLQDQNSTQEQSTDTSTSSTTSNTTYTSVEGIEIIVDQPMANSVVTSPLEVSGQVPGNWSFEADFPVELRDSSGSVLTQEPAQLQGDWMTEELVPFTVTLSWSESVSGEGQLVLVKDNPSGLSENDDSVTIPIRF